MNQCTLLKIAKAFAPIIFSTLAAVTVTPARSAILDFESAIVNQARADGITPITEGVFPTYPENGVTNDRQPIVEGFQGGDLEFWSDRNQSLPSEEQNPGSPSHLSFGDAAAENENR